VRNPRAPYKPAGFGGVTKAGRPPTFRDPARIERLVKLLRQIWRANPDLRLGQIVVKALEEVDGSGPIFYAEDHRTERGLQLLLEKVK
jgi:hypothetical protein